MSRKLFGHHVEPTGEKCAECEELMERRYIAGQGPPDGHHLKGCRNGCDIRDQGGYSGAKWLWRRLKR